MVSDLTLFQSLVLAVLQGITEFLPVSSSGHLVIARVLFHWSDDSGLLFDTILHAGSLAAILIYFHRDWLAVLKGYRNPRDPNFAWFRRLPWLLLVATVPVVITGPLLKPFLESDVTIRNSLVVGLSMLATALFFWFCERRSVPGGRPKLLAAKAGLRMPRPIGFLQALLIGCFQVVALLPGVSRSGWTAGAGMLCGQSRESAVRFAFIMALPAIGGAMVFQIKDLPAASVSIMPWLQIGLGFLVSFLVSLAAIHFCLMFFRAHSLRGFAVYLAAAGLLAILVPVICQNV